jgi:LuxR family transcriptional regulator
MDGLSGGSGECLDCPASLAGAEGWRGVFQQPVSRSGTPFTPTELSKNGPYIRWLADLAHGALSGTFLLGTDQDTLSLGLTVREIEILKWMADGKTSNDTAGILNLSVATVNFHMKNAISKLNAPNKTCAVAKALILGMLD